MSEDDLLQSVMERYTKVQRTEAEVEPWSVWLTVGNQSFQLAALPEDDAHAEWFRKMLAKALISLLAEQGTAPGIAFHVETGLTQARMARRTCGDLKAPIEYLDSVIEQLEEIDAKVKKEGTK